MNTKLELKEMFEVHFWGMKQFKFKPVFMWYDSDGYGKRCYDWTLNWGWWTLVKNRICNNHTIEESRCR